ncbi:predicted protein [Aspergillus nidulans FGSC A4]|uniref:Fe2OG dioxygenase domain-containing protein n=1 Tax=Emericella nidulans (strain FGSC A4 / ATCC 38163 / CBS 112.46 / NRRL 194 / M139) TaxID=227321 RepID=Q5B679_EMENI|nr:hypothetical protein [Aspergillus nidulans FGSC A4]EAA59260.1 predicted protein [Aspergillus nidulans FGSC A4]CBF75024.1 TPA: conserved hypothetical protein [Aspergillus nidulans FGSC A4]|eukprot:XP_661555.1 predicted protein [Aspergillus nidulans FGSC A4]
MARPKKGPIAPRTVSNRVIPPLTGIEPSRDAVFDPSDVASDAKVRSIESSPSLAEVDGVPPAWADVREPEDRAALASAIPWFTCYEGGMYHSKMVCYGFLLDGDSGNRCHIDDEVVITRIGGGCSKDRDGNLMLKKDMDEQDVTVRSLANRSKNTSLGRKLPHRYNVMAYFRVICIWAEKINGKTGYKVRFEKLDLSEKSWWAEKGTALPDPASRRFTQAESRQCATCLTPSTHVYKEGWMCLNRTCQEFWMLAGLEPPRNLTFDDRFLEARAQPGPDMQLHGDLIPDLLSTIDEHDPLGSSSPLSWKSGVVCPLCQKCIPRRFWNGWKCSDTLSGKAQGECPFEKWLKIPTVPLSAAIGGINLCRNKRTVIKNRQSSFLPQIDDRSFAPYKLITYGLGASGYIMHFVSNEVINSRPRGPNELFEELQKANLGLRRYPLDQAQVAGTLTAHFVTNFGAPYKYVVSVDSRGFSEACDPVLRALGRLTWATKNAVRSQGGNTYDPNELLLLGYFEEQKIGYHDDGESSLGPTIATLSLGSPATMAVRMKYKYYHGFTKAGREKNTLLTDDPILPECENYVNRQKLKERLLNGSITDDEYKKAWFDSFAENKSRNLPPDIIKIKLNHGDMVVMHGEGVQKYYEHGVKLEKRGKLRFALTARHVKKEEIPEQDWPKGDFTLTDDQIYDGQ